MLSTSTKKEMRTHTFTTQLTPGLGCETSNLKVRSSTYLCIGVVCVPVVTQIVDSFTQLPLVSVC